VVIRNVHCNHALPLRFMSTLPAITTLSPQTRSFYILFDNKRIRFNYRSCIHFPFLRTSTQIPPFHYIHCLMIFRKVVMKNVFSERRPTLFEAEFKWRKTPDFLC
jgi:hypothetical protein